MSESDSMRESECKMRGDRFSYYLVFLLLLSGSFALRIYRLDQQSLWGDEIASVLCANLNLAGLVAALLDFRNHVPLYFLLLHLWQKLTGQSEFSVRFFSLWWGLLSMPAIYRLGKEMGGSRLGLLSAFLLAISPFHSPPSDSPSLPSEEIWRLAAGPEHPERIWLVSALDIVDPHRFPESRNRLINQGCHFDQARKWFDQRYPISQQVTFTGICLTVYRTG